MPNPITFELMVKRIGRLVLGKMTEIYFLVLLAVTILGMYVVPLTWFIYLDIGLILVFVVSITGLIAGFVFSFRTNPTAYNKFLQWVCSIVLVITVLFVFISHHGNRVGYELEQHGVKTKGTIVDKNMRTGRYGPTVYSLTIQFADENEVSEIQTCTTIKSIFDQKQLQQEVPIEYSRRHPGLIRLIGQ